MKQLITFDHSEKHNVLNLSRVDPALIISKKVGKYDMVCIRNKKKPVLCVSVVAIQDDYTATPKTIGEENILKFITATPLTQEFERFAAVLCMTHGVETARCQLLDNLLTFSTRSGELLCFCLFQFLILAAEKISGSPKKSSTPRKNLFATFQSKATTTDKTSGYSYAVSSLSAHDISENFHLCLLPTDFDFFFSLKFLSLMPRTRKSSCLGVLQPLKKIFQHLKASFQQAQLLLWDIQLASIRQRHFPTMFPSA